MTCNKHWFYNLIFSFIFCFTAHVKAAVPYFPGLSLPEAKTINAGEGGDQAIILIVVCPSRPDFFTLYGGDKIPTDNLSALAKDGLTFTRMYANAPWTRAGTACVLTGRFASRHKCQQDTAKLIPSVLTIAERLKAKGYKTGGFVANGNASSIADLHRGFETHKDPKTYWNRLAKGHEVVDEALAWIQTVKNKRFFSLLFFVDPHDPYRAPPEYEKKYLKGLEEHIRRNAAWEYNNDYPKKEVEAMVAIYSAAYDYTDDQIGRFLNELKKMKLYNKATIIMTGDHAEGFGEHGFYLHAHHLENEIIQIPLIIKRPKISPAGYYSDVLVCQADVVPTILEIAGIPIPSDVDGMPLLSTLAGRGIPDSRTVFSEYNEFGIRRAAIIRRDAKLILERPADKEYLGKRLNGHFKFLPTVSFDKEVMTFYRLDIDPFEKKNRWDPKDPTAKALLKELRAFIAAGE